MRDLKTWEEKVRPAAVQKFTKRIQEDLNRISLKDLPPLRSYYIQGPVGSGKTILAAFLTLEYVKKRYLEMETGFVYFLTVPEFLNEIKSSYEDPDRNEQDVLEKYSNAAWLVLDDFGAERSTDWAMSMLYLLINRRYEEVRTTIITSNLTLQELAEKLGDERIPARVERMCDIIEQKRFDEKNKTRKEK